MFRFVLVCILSVLIISGCSGWVVTPIPYTPPTLFPTRTPLIFSPTPLILAPPVTATFTPPTLIATQFTATLLPTTFTPSATPGMTDTPIAPTQATDTGPTPFAAIRTNILGCNTSIDIAHGMGEVTNAYVTIGNIGAAELKNVCATLRGLDEGRPHPDKTKCVPSLPAGYQVTQKLTVDTTFQKNTPIQVDVTYDLGLIQRVAEDACTNIGIFTSNDGLGVIKPILQP
ncbi:MAG: hypothetical protein HYR70_13040 [Chloroflexi bacterium]|nr:hypothetical protein [Chloroflexota bacterium]MBI3339556.1 hypothetical protein [Chloroflexota bacterium]